MLYVFVGYNYYTQSSGLDFEEKIKIHILDEVKNDVSLEVASK